MMFSSFLGCVACGCFFGGGKVKIDYMLTASGLAFSTAENCHDKMCHAWMAKLWDKYERLAESFAQELKTLSR